MSRAYNCRRSTPARTRSGNAYAAHTHDSALQRRIFSLESDLALAEADREQLCDQAILLQDQLEAANTRDASALRAASDRIAALEREKRRILRTVDDGMATMQRRRDAEKAAMAEMEADHAAQVAYESSVVGALETQLGDALEALDAVKEEAAQLSRAMAQKPTVRQSPPRSSSTPRAAAALAHPLASISAFRFDDIVRDDELTSCRARSATLTSELAAQRAAAAALEDALAAAKSEAAHIAHGAAALHSVEAERRALQDAAAASTAELEATRAELATSRAHAAELAERVERHEFLDDLAMESPRRPALVGAAPAPPPVPAPEPAPALALASASAALEIAAQQRTAHDAALAAKEDEIATLQKHLAEFSKVVECLRANGVAAETLAAERLRTAEEEAEEAQRRVEELEMELELVLHEKAEAEAEGDRYGSPVRASFKCNPAQLRAEVKAKTDEVHDLTARFESLRTELTRQHASELASVIASSTEEITTVIRELEEMRDARDAATAAAADAMAMATAASEKVAVLAATMSMAATLHSDAEEAEEARACEVRETPAQLVSPAPALPPAVAAAALTPSRVAAKPEMMTSLVMAAAATAVPFAPAATLAANVAAERTTCATPAGDGEHAAENGDENENENENENGNAAAANAQSPAPALPSPAACMGASSGTKTARGIGAAFVALQQQRKNSANGAGASPTLLAR